MPTIKTVSGARIALHTDDHRPAHVHVIHEKKQIRLQISDAEPMDPIGSFHPRVLRDVQEWLRLNRDIVVEEWAKYHGKDD